jgi:hypothetical protein
MTATDILVIGDPHAKPGVSNRRFDWLGRYIADTAPKVVVNMGDLFDMESLSSYDKGKKSFEGRRYAKDIEAGNEALDRISRKIKGMRKKPRLVSLIGNHEQRIMRACDEHPELDGKLGYHDFQFRENGHEVVDFLDPVVIAGFAFAHYFGSGLMMRPIGGENHAVTLLKTQFMSCVQGHTHLKAEAERTRADGQKIQGFVAGCYLDPDQKESYAGRANVMWYRGLLHLKDVENGYAASHAWIAIDSLRRQCG